MPGPVKASAAVRALAEAQLQGGLISSHLVSDQDRPLSDDAARKVDDLLSSAAATEAIPRTLNSARPTAPRGNSLSRRINMRFLRGLFITAESQEPAVASGNQRQQPV